jgi:hypothetical protein
MSVWWPELLRQLLPKFNMHRRPRPVFPPASPPPPACRGRGIYSSGAHILCTPTSHKRRAPVRQTQTEAHPPPTATAGTARGGDGGRKCTKRAGMRVWGREGQAPAPFVTQSPCQPRARVDEPAALCPRSVALQAAGGGRPPPPVPPTSVDVVAAHTAGHSWRRCVPSPPPPN